VLTSQVAISITHVFSIGHYHPNPTLSGSTADRPSPPCQDRTASGRFAGACPTGACLTSYSPKAGSKVRPAHRKDLTPHAVAGTKAQEPYFGMRVPFICAVFQYRPV
jgi:hypothetical protein